MQRDYQMRAVHETDFLFFRRYSRRKGLFVDVGANVGQSALSFGSLCRHHSIVSIEPNPAMTDELEMVGRLLGSRFEYRIIGLSDTPGSLILNVPVFQSNDVSGEASFKAQDDLMTDQNMRRRIGGSFSIREVSVPVITFDSLGLQPDIVKIDVQGFEHSVLRGMRDTLTETRPIIMLEASRDLPAIAETLHTYDYELNHFDHRNDVLQPFGEDDLIPERRAFHLNYFAIPT
jgi:FkbM family methyltransferase